MILKCSGLGDERWNNEEYKSIDCSHRVNKAMLFAVSIFTDISCCSWPCPFYIFSRLKWCRSGNKKVVAFKIWIFCREIQFITDSVFHCLTSVTLFHCSYCSSHPHNLSTAIKRYFAWKMQRAFNPNAPVTSSVPQLPLSLFLFAGMFITNISQLFFM